MAALDPYVRHHILEPWARGQQLCKPGGRRRPLVFRSAENLTLLKVDACLGMVARKVFERRPGILVPLGCFGAANGDALIDVSNEV